MVSPSRLTPPADMTRIESGNVEFDACLMFQGAASGTTSDIEIQAQPTDFANVRASRLSGHATSPSLQNEAARRHLTTGEWGHGHTPCAIGAQFPTGHRLIPWSCRWTRVNIGQK
ncbi:hypothetical protein LSAT2_000455 [Lamellibrachia satsuma]|nr:hypothetical protein LSAT2_000455 [Lamellibrachia satsuma]